MGDKLLNPNNKHEIPDNLILIPNFFDKKYFNRIKKKAIRNFSLFFSTVLIFESYSIITDFIGYTQLLTILEFIKDIREKNIYFLGTAGSINPEFKSPEAFMVNEINPSAIFDSFADKKSYKLISTGDHGFTGVKGVSVDILQRETSEWLKDQIVNKNDIVEMEIYPLRDFIGKEFFAFVVITDLITKNGIDLLKNKKKINSELIRSFEHILELISEK
ncbi:MAG: hypothetical protein ABFR75_01495 [Acidobacteriota bacterium]